MLFAHIRAAAPSRISDDVVAQGMVEAKRAGIHGPDDVRIMGMNGNALYILGNFPGRSASIDVSQPVPSLPQSVNVTEVINQQGKQTVTTQAQHQEQDRAQAPARSLSLA